MSPHNVEMCLCQVLKLSRHIQYNTIQSPKKHSLVCYLVLFLILTCLQGKIKQKMSNSHAAVNHAVDCVAVAVSWEKSLSTY